MKKSAIIIFIVLFVLMIPVPSGVYKDGGTREYTALTYKIVYWNKSVDADTQYTKTKVYLFPENFKSVNSLWYKERKALENSKNTEHTHEFAAETNTVDTEPRGYCGNTITEICIDGKDYSFWGDKSVYLTDLFLNLDYKQEDVCDCLAEYVINTEMCSNYEVSLSQSFVRCKKGQVALNEDQTKEIKDIIEWAQRENYQLYIREVF